MSSAVGPPLDADILETLRRCHTIVSFVGITKQTLGYHFPEMVLHMSESAGNSIGE